MSKKALIGLIVIGLIIVTSIVSMFVSMPQQDKGVATASNTIGVIMIEGVIGQTTNILGIPQNINDPVEQIRKAQEDNAVRAVVVKINSPGGSAAKSIEIYKELKKLKKNWQKNYSFNGRCCCFGGIHGGCCRGHNSGKSCYYNWKHWRYNAIH